MTPRVGPVVLVRQVEPRMAFGIIATAAIWIFGHYMNVPRQARFLVLALIYVLILVIHVVLPEGHPLRVFLGGNATPWLALAVVAAVIFGYITLLARIRQKVSSEKTAPEQAATDASATEIQRYARHIILREIGGQGQMRLRKARVLVIGAGGLGSPALLYLAAAGVGTIGVVDDDDVELANLQRQIIHRDQDIDVPKVFSAERAIRDLNPYVEVKPYHRRLTEDIAVDLIADFDLVLDGSDNFDTRYLANRACIKNRVPLISGALTQWEGQVSVFDPARDAPCYRCLFDQPPAAGLAPSCAEAGVLGPLPGVLGAMMAAEAVKVIVDIGAPLRGQMMIYDALYGETRHIRVSRRGDCPDCGTIV